HLRSRQRLGSGRSGTLRASCLAHPEEVEALPERRETLNAGLDTAEDVTEQTSIRCLTLEVRLLAHVGDGDLTLRPSQLTLPSLLRCELLEVDLSGRGRLELILEAASAGLEPRGVRLGGDIPERLLVRDVLPSQLFLEDHLLVGRLLVLES